MMHTKQEDLMQQHLAQNSILLKNNSILEGYGNWGLATMHSKTILSPPGSNFRKRGANPRMVSNILEPPPPLDRVAMVSV